VLNIYICVLKNTSISARGKRAEDSRCNTGHVFRGGCPSSAVCNRLLPAHVTQSLNLSSGGLFARLVHRCASRACLQKHAHFLYPTCGTRRSVQDCYSLPSADISVQGEKRKRGVLLRTFSRIYGAI